MRDGQTFPAASAGVAGSPVERVFPGRPDRVAAVRAYVADCLTGAGWPTLVADAVLCVDELFANAVRHTRSGEPGGEVAVRVEPVGAAVVCHVHDQGGPSVPAPGSPQRGGESGRGLPIVAALASACGGTNACDVGSPLRGGCCVWFKLERGVAR